MKNRFDLEQEIMDCWGVVDDIDTIYHAEHLYENKDEMMNALLGVKTLYKLKFERLVSTFEDCVKQQMLKSNDLYSDIVSDGGMDPRYEYKKSRTKKDIQIVDCTDSLLWYYDHLGRIFSVISEEEDIYWTCEPSGYKNIVYKKDCVLC